MIEELFQEAAGKSLYPGVQSLHYNEIMRFANALIKACRKDEPVRIYDYVWPQRPEDEENCSYACNYSPAQHLAKGELLAVVHPRQLKNSYLERE